MNKTLCSLKWDTYTSNVCKGFANLQQREEFVDMTLAAEGHLVHVHKNLMALASPYIKGLIKSAPCPHPVVFLNDVKYENLQYIMEYIYTGEVLVPIENLVVFIRTAKALCIEGLKDFQIPQVPYKRKVVKATEESLSKRVKVSQPIDVNNITVSTPPFEPQYPEFESNAIDVNIMANSQPIEHHYSENGPHAGYVHNTMEQLQTNDYNEGLCMEPVISNHPETVNFVETLQSSNIPKQPMVNPTDNKEECVTAQAGVTVPSGNVNPAPKDLIITINPLTIQQSAMKLLKKPLEPKVQYKINVEQNSDGQNNIHFETVSNDNAQKSDAHDKVMSWMESNDTEHINTTDNKTNSLKDAKPLYTIGFKNSLQLILNRFMYYSHHQSSKRHRWRCINYRDLRCKAYIDTDNEVIKARKFEHIHGHHDEKIIMFGRKATYTSIEEAKLSILNSLKPQDFC